MLKQIRFLAFLLFTTGALAGPEAGDSAFVNAEVRLKVLADSVLRGATDGTRLGAVSAFNSEFWDVLNLPGSFRYPFDSLTSVSKVISADGKFRIFTWILPAVNGDSYRYYGIVQSGGPNNPRPFVSGLTEARWSSEEAAHAELNTSNWYGAVYYKMIETKIDKQHQAFTLLGWHGNNRLTTQKVIDILVIDQYGNLDFGAPVFDQGKDGLYHRVIFEYDASAVMLLRYDKKKKMIVFDHLSPSSPALKGKFEHYGPDFTYDGYRFKRGKWTLKTNLPLKNEVR